MLGPTQHRLTPLEAFCDELLAELLTVDVTTTWPWWPYGCPPLPDARAVVVTPAAVTRPGVRPRESPSASRSP